MPEEIFRSQDFTINYPTEADLNIAEGKTVEKAVTLPGMDHSITVKIHTSLSVSNEQVEEAIAQSMDVLKDLAEELEASSAPLELKLSLTTDTQETAKISALFAKSSPGKVAEQLKEASRNQKYHLTESKIEEIAQAIIAHGDSALQQAKESGQKVLVNTDHPDIQLVATKSGKLYVKVSVLGTGFFKETALFANVVDSNRETQAKHAAVGVPKSIPLPADSSERKRLEREYQNEVHLHQNLTALRKEATKNGLADPLPHVAISKIITYNNPSSVALMGIPYNGGDVNTRIKEKSLRQEEKALICADFLSGTAELHAAGVIHRDIKADNILLQTEERLLPKEEWPTDGVEPPGYRIEWKNDMIKSVRQTIVVKAILCDLGKGSQLDPTKRFYNSALYNEVMPPGRYTQPAVHYSPELDVYSAGRAAYQIFAGIPVNELRGVARDAPERRAITDQMKAIHNQIREAKDNAELSRLNEQLRPLEQQLVDWDEKNLGPPADWPGWNTIPPKVQEYIQRMVDKDPAKRPKAAEAASFFRSLTPEDLPIPMQTTQDEPNKNASAGYSGYQSEPSSEPYRSIGYSSEDT
ncbi:MAG: hypothetical protein LLG04_05945 [Parachlamydia sp.]|nr:hypothetical protein [Parachlamydia sp.]